MSEIKKNVGEELRKLCESDEDVAAVCEVLRTYQRGRWETTTARICFHLIDAGYDLKRSQVTAAFKRLQGLGLGTFVAGRRGGESRFVFAERVTVIARLLAGEEIDVIEHDLTGEDTQVFPETIEHSFNLRPDFTLSVELPSDLTEFEAKRLAQFFGCLAFQPD
jgi:hypothetical protein